MKQLQSFNSIRLVAMISVLVQRIRRIALSWKQVSLTSAMVVLLFTTFVPTAGAVLAATGGHKSTTAPYKGKPNLYQPQTGSADATQVHDGKLAKPATHAPKGATSTAATAKPYAPTMQPMHLVLSATQPVHATSNDGLLDVTVPAGSVSAADLASAGGSASLSVLQVAPPSGSTNGGYISLGTYLLQVQDSKGHELAAGHGLQHPLTLTYHAPWKSLPVALNRFKLVVNGVRPVTLPIAATQFGKPQTITAQADTTANTLTAQVQPLSSSSTGSFVSDSPQGWFGKADATKVGLQTGDLEYGISLDVPRGPGDLTPPLNLGYSSNALSQTHNSQAAAPWVGEGWSLDMGEITWSESLSGASGTWQSTWSMSDPYGDGGQLLPPSTCFSTYYDDTTCTKPAPPAVTNWHLATDAHIKIISYTNPTADCTHFPVKSQCGSGTYSQQPPCFRVWLQNGLMEEFGCTMDARQWYPGNGGMNYMSAWLLDMITDTNGNQIHITYDQDIPSGASYTRDVVMSSITWDNWNCHDAQHMCTGSNWSPTYQVIFSHSPSVAYPYPGAPSCNAQSGGLRCDDPVAETSPNIGTPMITQTQVLNSVSVQVWANQWNTLRSYRFYYGQAALNPNAINDPVTGNTESVAGYLLLDEVQELGTDNSTAYPPLTFAYAVNTQQYYEDSSLYPATDAWDPTVQGECGGEWNSPSGMQQWNWGNNVGDKTQSYPAKCTLWARSYALFSMSSLDNGQGMHETFGWTDMRTNQHGVPSGSNALDPTACTTLQKNGPDHSLPLQCRYPDDRGWSHMALTSRTITVGTPTSANANAVQTMTYTYTYRITALTAQMCGDCTVGMYWGDANDVDFLDYYNGRFAGFAFVQVNNPDGSQDANYFYTTEGWGLYSSSLACHDGQSTCPQSPYWDEANAAGGQPYEVDAYNNGNNALMQQTLTSYAVTCPPSGVSADTSYGELASNQDTDNPVVNCDVQTSNVKTYITDGINNPTDTTVPMKQTAYTYGAYGFLTTQTTTGNDFQGASTIVHQTDVVYNDNVQTSTMPPTGTFLVKPADDLIEDGSGNIVTCKLDDYDRQFNATGASSTLTQGLLTQVTQYTNCATYNNWTGEEPTLYGYNTNGDPFVMTDADAWQGIAGHTASTGYCTGFTACTTYDSWYGTMPTVQYNDLNQTTTTSYTTTAAFGFGQWPSSVTDANGQTTSTTYDVLGRVTSTTLPGEGTGLTTTSTAYDDFCNATGAQGPCLEVDQTQRLNSTTTVTSRGFYNGLGQLVETRTPGPNNQDVIVNTAYDVMGHKAYQSLPYFVPAYTGAPGSAAYYVPQVNGQGQFTQAGGTWQYNGMDQVTVATDANSATTTTTYTTSCTVENFNGLYYCFVVDTTVDANSHQTQAIYDARGLKIFDQTYTGNSGSTYAPYSTVYTLYDEAGQPYQIFYPDNNSYKYNGYDGLGRLTYTNDPDLNQIDYFLDPNGNLTAETDPQGSTNTVYFGYDGLNRKTWISTNSDGSNPLATYTYDSTANGNVGIGRLTSETFASGPNQSVTGGYAYTYDARGQQTGWTMTLGSTSYPFTTGYNDAGQATTLSYPDGDTVTTNYSAQDWLSGVTEQQGSTNNTLLNSIVYSGANGASAKPTSATVGNNTYQWAFGYDLDLRLSDTNVTLVSNNNLLFDQTRTYDAIGNVATANTTVPAGTDNQVFCYDELNRLTWAGSTGTPACSQSLTSGTLTSQGALYQQAYAYDVDNRLTQGPLGSGYTYGDTTHIDAVTSAPNYSASYDAAGDMTSRNGQVLGYDLLHRLISWQNTANNPTQTASYAYDGEGSRVQQVSTANSTTTTTSSIGSFEEVSTTGSSTTTTKYYSAGVAKVTNVNGTLSYLVADDLGSVSEALSSSGGVQATQLYSPYGTVRYSNGTMPTSYGYTGQRADPSGLMYYNARYYDPSAGQFITADTVQGLNRYAYVAGNPETRTDPTGNMFGGPECPDGDCHDYVAGLRQQYQSTHHGGGGTTTAHPCGGSLTPAQCQFAESHKNKKISEDGNDENLMYGVMTLVEGGRDLYDLINDKSGSALKLLADGIGLIGDIANGINYLIDWAQSNFHWNLSGLKQAVNVIGVAANFLAGVLKTIQSVQGFFGGVVKFVADRGLGLAWNFIKRANIGGLILTVAGLFLKTMVDSGFDAIIHFAQAKVNNDELDIQEYQSMSDTTYCNLYGCPNKP